MSIDKALPKDWKWVKLGEVSEIVSGNTPKGIDQISNKGDHQFYKVSDMNLEGNEQGMNVSNNKLTKEEIEKFKLKVFPKGTVIFPKRGGAILTNKKRILTRNASFDLNLMGILPNESIISKYLFYWIQKLDLSKIYDGSNVPQINNKNIAPLDFPLPTIDIQNILVSKIEELFSELDKGIENLRLAQQQLKTYRQSVLKWAFEGRLTNENVKEGELPEGWTLTKLGDHIKNINSGKSYRCDERPPKKDEVGIIKVSSVTWGFFDESESKTCYSNDLLVQKHLIKRGDFLFSRANTIDLIGSCVLVSNISRTLMLSDKILRFVFCDSILPEYVLYYLRSRNGRRQIKDLSTGNQDSMRNIGQEKIKAIQIFYCDKSEQKRIVQEIEKKMSNIERLDHVISQSLQKIDFTKKSILNKAFKGELV